MGCSYYATAILGYKIDLSGFERQEERDQCKHEVPKGAKFCPTCGKKVEKIMEIVGDDNLEDFRENFLYNLPKGMFGEIEYDDYETCYFGFGAAVSDDNGGVRSVSVQEISEMKEQIHSVLEPYTKTGQITLEDKDFKLWSILTVSC